MSIEDIIDGLDRSAVEAQQSADNSFDAGNYELQHYYLGAVYAYSSTALQLRELIGYHFNDKLEV
jgi:hypothetical protein